MTATPHAGIEEDFRLFLALLDPIASRGGPGRSAHGRCLRHHATAGEGEAAHVRRHAAVPRAVRLHGRVPTVRPEALLYKRVTEYVGEEMNRAERLKAEGEGRRGASWGSR